MSWLSDLFGGGKKVNMAYSGERPVTSLSTVQGGPEYYKTLQERMAGRGVGYGSDYESLSNPMIAQLHNAYTGYQLPELKSELTATGRRAGSSGFQQLARSGSDQADKENSIMAQLMQRNAEASHNDVNSAVEGMGNYAKTNAELADRAANFDQGIWSADKNYQIGSNAARTQGAQNLLGMGVNAAMIPFTGGMSALGAPSANAYGTPLDLYRANPYRQPSAAQRLLQRAGQSGGYSLNPSSLLKRYSY